MDKQQYTLGWLDAQGIPYALRTHPAAFTMEDIRAFGVDAHGEICKNLFLRDAKGKRHFLVSVRGDKRVDLKTLGAQLGTRLSFASAERLQTHLGLHKGEVTPLGVLFDEAAAVEVLLDADLAGAESIGVHPCNNTATVFVSFGALCAALAAARHEPQLVHIPTGQEETP